MKSSRILAAFAVSLCFASVPSARAASLMIEGEAFQFKGKWVVEKSSDCLGTAMLRVYQDSNRNSESDALTVVSIPEAGTYRVWTRSQDFAGTVRPRTFTLSVDDREMQPSGAHGFAGFKWECVGEVTLGRKQVLMRLSDTGCYFGRCDAIYLTTDAEADPNTMTNTEIARSRRNPVTMPWTDNAVPSLGKPLEISSGYSTLASASNGEIRLSFVKLEGNEIVCKTDYYADGSWRRYASAAEDNRVALISGTESNPVNYNNFYPSWSECRASRTMTFGGSDYPVNLDGDKGNPYFAGALAEARATAVTKTAANVIKVTYDCGNAGTLTGYWTVPESGSHINVRFVFRPVADGWYSLALHGAKGVDEAKVKGGIMPPMFAGLRLPDGPQMLFSSMMTQCVAAVETDGTSTSPATAFVAADLSAFPAEWGGIDRSPLGFCLRNSEDEYQAVGISPLPGMSDSKVKAGRTLEVRFVAGIRPADWTGTLEYVSERVFGVTDYRRPAGCSMTATMENIIDLIKNDEYAGWEPSLKGFWDIEANGNTTPTVVQASPLAIVGASALSNDEDFYARRALPTIEYALSRGGYRTRMNEPAALNPVSSQFPTTLYEGIHSLLGGLNPWLSALGLPEGETRQSNGYFSTLQPLSQEIAAYRLTGDETRLDKARGYADRFAAECLNDGLPAVAAGTFYNSQMCPDWTPLLDIYRLTGEERYLDAATHAAAYTMAGVKTWPQVAEGTMTVHPGGKFEGVTTVWWKGTEPWRLGFPRQEGDAPEHQVDAASVSSVGLGIEQPATYFVRTAGKSVRPVYLNSWAPRLCELGALSGRQVFETYGRNAIVGRSENYPGYYATGYTDIVGGPRFPYEGPDVSSIYFHHISAHLAMIQDYIVTEMISRSGGEVDFPAARQEGFVWFANNVYGAQTGRVRGEKATLWMPRGCVAVEEPEINVLTARGESKLHILLANDGAEEVKAGLTLAPETMARLRSTSAELWVPGESPKTVELASDGRLRADVAAAGMVIISIPADFSDIALPEPLADGMRVIDTDTEAGRIYLYRIRSPFGRDDVYGFASCGAVEGLTIEAECRGEVNTATAWPYEWSFARFGYDEPSDVKIRISKNGRVLGEYDANFAGGATGLESVVVDEGSPSPLGTYTLTGIRIDKLTAPGLYIVDGKKKYIGR